MFLLYSGPLYLISPSHNLSPYFLLLSSSFTSSFPHFSFYFPFPLAFPLISPFLFLFCFFLSSLFLYFPFLAPFQLLPLPSSFISSFLTLSVISSSLHLHPPSSFTSSFLILSLISSSFHLSPYFLFYLFPSSPYCTMYSVPFFPPLPYVPHFPAQLSSSLLRQYTPPKCWQPSIKLHDVRSRESADTIMHTSK